MADEAESFSFEGKTEAEVIVETPAPEVTTTAESTDPVINEKDKNIEQEKPEITKPGEGDKTPGATPPTIPERTEEQQERIQPKEQTAPEIKFANDESKRLHELIVAGKKEEAFAILAEQNRLEKLSDLKPEEIVKLNLQYQNKNLDAAEINDLFNEQYALPKEPVQRSSELDEEFEERKAEYDESVKRIQNRITRDSKAAVTELEKYKQNIVLPDLPKADQAPKEPTQEELDAQKKAFEGFTEAAVAELGNFKGYSTTFKSEGDEAKIEFPVAYQLSEADKAKLAPLIAKAHVDAGGFFSDLGWLDKNGNINTSKLAEDAAILVNRQSIIDKMVADTAGEMRKALAKNIKNVDFSGSSSSSPNTEKSNEEKQKDFVKGFFEASTK